MRRKGISQYLDSRTSALLILSILIFITGCHYDIRFEDIAYSTGSSSMIPDSWQ